LAAEFTEIVSYTWSLFLAAGIRFGQNLYFDNENEELRSEVLFIDTQQLGVGLEWERDLNARALDQFLRMEK